MWKFTTLSLAPFAIHICFNEMFIPTLSKYMRICEYACKTFLWYTKQCHYFCWCIIYLSISKYYLIYPNKTFETAPEPVSRHMEDQGVEFLQFAFRWFNCLLIREVCSGKWYFFGRNVIILFIQNSYLSDTEIIFLISRVVKADVGKKKSGLC